MTDLSKEEAQEKTIEAQGWLKKRTMCLFQFATMIYELSKHNIWESAGYKTALEWWQDKFHMGRANYFVYKRLGKVVPKILEWVPDAVLHSMDMSRIIDAIKYIDRAKTKRELLYIYEQIKKKESKKVTRKLSRDLHMQFVVTNLYGTTAEISNIQYKDDWAKKASVQTLSEVYGDKVVDAVIKLPKRR